MTTITLDLDQASEVVVSELKSDFFSTDDPEVQVALLRVIRYYLTMSEWIEWFGPSKCWVDCDGMVRVYKDD